MINASRHRPKKLIRISVAAKILGESRSTVKARIARRELEVIQGEFKTSPQLVWQAQVEKRARELGRI